MHEVKTEAGEKMHEAKVQAADTMHEVKEQASEKMDQARAQAHEATEKAGGYVRSMVDQRTEQAGQWLTETGRELTEAGDTFRERGDSVPAQASEFIGRKVRDLGSYMQTRDGDELLQEAQDYARKNVWALTIGGLVLGFAAARAVGAGYRYRHDEPYGRSYTQEGRPGFGGPAYPETAEMGTTRPADERFARGQTPTEPHVRPVGREYGSQSGPERPSGASYG
jgi:hypothetical protein